MKMVGIVLHFSQHVAKMQSRVVLHRCQASSKTRAWKTLCHISPPHTFLRHDAHPLTLSFKILYFLFVSPFLPTCVHVSLCVYVYGVCVYGRGHVEGVCLFAWVLCTCRCPWTPRTWNWSCRWLGAGLCECGNWIKVLGKGSKWRLSLL